LFAHLQRLSLRFHDRQRTGDLITRLTSDTQAIEEMIANGMIAALNRPVGFKPVEADGALRAAKMLSELL